MKLLQSKLKTSLAFTFCSINNQSLCTQIPFSNTVFEYKTRQQHLEQIQNQQEYDIIIIGGGSTGCGTLLSASRKQLSACLIESGDFGCGTSTKSTKLLHGGLRYWQNLFDPFSQSKKQQDFYLIREGLEERNIILQNADYITNEIGMVFPSSNFFKNMFNFTGILMYHYLGYFYVKDKNYISRPKFLFPKNMNDLFPLLNKKLKYGVLFYDGQFEESRMIMDSLLTATSLKVPFMKQGNILNYAQFTNFIFNPEGKIIGVEVYDKINKKKFNIKSKVVINATGPFGDEIRGKTHSQLKQKIIPVKGDHITLPRKLFNHQFGLITETQDKRIMYYLPWNNVIIAGTTEEGVDRVTTHPIPNDSKIQEITDNFQEVFPDVDVQIQSKWSGLRPLIKDSSVSNTDKISRVHFIENDEQSGLISILGGKWTIFRKMGEEAVQLALEQLFKRKLISEKEFQEKTNINTKNLHLIGNFQKNQEFEQSSNVQIEQTNKRLQSYGIRSNDILSIISKDKNKGKFLDEQFLVTQAEIEYLIQTEMIELPVDLLVRRLRITFQDSNLAFKILPKIVEIYGNVKGWNQQQKQEEYQKNLEILKLMKFNQL